MKVIILALLFSSVAYAKPSLTLEYMAEVQMELKDPTGPVWITHAVRHVAHGVGGLQVWLDPQGRHRIKITARKPHDVRGSFKIRMPSRSDGVVANPNSDTVSIIFGPHEGCPDSEARCKPLTENDLGNVELRLDLEKAKQSSLGVMLLRPYKDASDIAIRPALSYEGKEVKCNTKVEKGWWIFASRMVADTVDAISVCVREPDGNVECAKDQAKEIKIKIQQTGTYEFTIWNSSPYEASCVVQAE